MMNSNMPIPQTENLDDIDIQIGKRIRFRRNLLGITQEGLAKQLGISFQQVQKYESGQNKIYASRLYHISAILKTPITLFFEDESAKMRAGMSDNEQEHFIHNDLMDKSETATLIRTYYEITDKKKRKNIVEMMKDLKSL